MNVCRQDGIDHDWWPEVDAASYEEAWALSQLESGSVTYRYPGGSMTRVADPIQPTCGGRLSDILLKGD